MNIFEHGICLTEGESLSGLNLKLIATTKLPIYSSFNLSIVDNNEDSLNHAVASMFEIDHAHSNDEYYQEYDLRYCVLSALYHLARLIDLYVLAAESFEKMHFPETTVSGNTHCPNIFYEIDAFLTSGRRVYDMISKMLWKHYHPGESGGWSSMKNAVKSLDKVPIEFADELRASWSQFGVKLKDYRDCVMHFVPLHKISETCWLNRHFGKWGVTVKLPANPEEKSRRKLDYDSGPDALTYCHEVAVHLVELCKSLTEQHPIGSYFRNQK
jgi:hypothetical protein